MLRLSSRLRAGLYYHTRENRYRVRRDLFRTPILWHSGDIDSVWKEKQAELERIIERAAVGFGEFDSKRTEAMPRLGISPWRLPGDLLYHLYVRQYILRVMVDAARGDRRTWRRIGNMIKEAFASRRGSSKRAL